MKKIYLLLLCATTFQTKAQTVDFETLIIPQNSAWDGSDLSGTPNSSATIYDSTFVFSGLTFNNQWTTDFGGYLYNGWVFSNKTDDNVSGYAGAYNSYAGGGNNNSSNYAVTYVGPGQEIKFANTTTATINSIAITNNTYAAFSMLNGDNIGKKFGGVTGNDPDWFLLDIIGYNSNGIAIDTIKFYLADYRFTDNAQDYIIKEWATVDLSSLGEVNKLKFELSSSDNGQSGMNTPAYLALDDIKFGYTSIDENQKLLVSIYPNPSTNIINIKTSKTLNGEIKIYSLMGQQLMHQSLNHNLTSLNVHFLSKGTYILQLTTKNESINTTFIKE